jgi:hypothetical protein
VLVVGCFLSFVGRGVAAANPKSANAYLFYRVLNVNAVMPVMQAANALLADACGGRQTDLYIKMNRRLFMVLALVRISFTRLAAARAAKGDSAATILMWAARSILVSGIIFSLTVKESLKSESRVRFSALGAVKNSAVFFLKSQRRLLLAAALIIRMLPMFSASAMMALQKYDYGWGASERALFSNANDIADVLCPLVLDEILQIKPKRGREALIWASRFSALALANIALTPFPKTILLNTILERLVGSQPFFDELLEAERVKDVGVGEGLMDSAVSTLEFPVGLIIPPLLLGISNRYGYRVPYYLLTAALLFNGEVMSGILTK